MSDAAILATFSDLRLVRGRKVGQLVFEIPIERVKAALDVLGMPDPVSEVWCGIARVDTVKLSGPNPSLTPGPAEGGAATGEASAPPSKPNSTRAVMMARDAEFQRFAKAGSEIQADAYIKRVCGVESKSELNNGDAADVFDRLRASYRDWRRSA